MVSSRTIFFLYIEDMFAMLKDLNIIVIGSHPIGQNDITILPEYQETFQ